MTQACIAIGSNLGDRPAYVALAREELQRLPGTRLLAFSSAHETDPIGPAGQEKYLNAAAVVETPLEPHDLLDHLRRIERLAGRERHERWASRTLDLDLLLYGDRVIQTDALTVPHPRMHERRFVLEPLAQIAPDTIHPILKQSVAELLAGIKMTPRQTPR